MLVFYFFAAVLIFLSYKSFRGGIDYLKFFKQELSKPESDFTPFCSVIAPCRGLDADLSENLAALFRQDFPAYEIIFVVDDENDESVKIIKEISRKGAKDAKLIVAGKAENESQKVHNLREAVLQVDEKSEVLVFVDSDARPSENWLRNLIAPLQNEKIGAATGYRWFISKKRNFASEMRSVWNASIASALGANTKSNFCWGGSLAIRRETFEKLQIREKWRGTLSDDFAVTRALKAAGLPIFFVPQALTASVEDCAFRELLEFTTRQMKITRVYAPNLWKASFVGSFLFNLVFIWGVSIIVYRLIYGGAVWLPLLALILVSAFSIGKAWLRLNAVKSVLRDYEKELSRQFWVQNTLWILSPALFFYNCCRALFSRKITWRGIEYELQSANETRILSNSREEKIYGG
ncbi:MAG TPA: glycosyltransferase family 2 protein [Pyrinomonadaceae bacterium]|nr:glycosyltransferase family 2 protein [Pyrinomonadaceae bacterium]